MTRSNREVTFIQPTDPPANIDNNEPNEDVEMTTDYNPDPSPLNNLNSDLSSQWNDRLNTPQHMTFDPSCWNDESCYFQDNETIFPYQSPFPRELSPLYQNQMSPNQFNPFVTENTNNMDSDIAPLSTFSSPHSNRSNTNTPSTNIGMSPSTNISGHSTLSQSRAPIPVLRNYQSPPKVHNDNSQQRQRQRQLNNNNNSNNSQMSYVDLFVCIIQFRLINLSV